jgi:hypothetical protein
VQLNRRTCHREVIAAVWNLLPQPIAEEIEPHIAMLNPATRRIKPIKKPPTSPINKIKRKVNKKQPTSTNNKRADSTNNKTKRQRVKK